MPQKKSSKTNEDIKFEDALKRIEEINTVLSEGNCGLDDSLELFAEGTKLISICSERLKKAKQKIQMVTECEDNE